MERTCGAVLFPPVRDGPNADHVPAVAGLTPAGQGRLRLPGRLHHPGDLSAQCQSAEAQSAHAKLAEVSAWTSAQLAAVVLT